ncbi:hypothetical protein CR513_62999, partial [Mucuna pruriens]
MRNITSLHISHTISCFIVDKLKREAQKREPPVKQQLLARRAWWHPMWDLEPKIKKLEKRRRQGCPVASLGERR